jgi:DNA-binding transcriptional LysR family regulator
VPLYHERFQLLTRAGSPLSEREKVTWVDVARIPLCLLTPDMQNRRIIDRLLLNAATPPPLESNSMLVLFSYARISECACVVPEKVVSVLSVSEPLRAIPIVEPREIYTIGLVSARREPIPPLTKALVAEASRLAIPQNHGTRRNPR